MIQIDTELLVSSAQMRAIEQRAIESGQVTGRALMERAGRGVVEALLAHWPELGARRPFSAVILCGPGNNAGDGFVVARLLRERGWAVAVRFLGQAERLPTDARANFDLWNDGNAPGIGCSPVSEPDLVVDALFGIGLSRPIEGAYAACLAQYKGVRRVAIDVPSGLCADSGRSLGLTCPVDLTVTFHAAKPGHFLADGAELCGKVQIVDIGLEPMTRNADIAGLVGAPRGLEKTSGHKFNHGHAFVLTGGFGRTGAARLAARAALRIGAGLVTLGVPRAATLEVASQISALMMVPLDDIREFYDVLADARISAMCLGPGLGIERARDLVPVALSSDRAVVLDADALSAFSDDPELLFSRLHPNCVLTPHIGEFARLFPDLAQALNGTAEAGPAFSKLDAARLAGRRANCVVVLKGADTVIATADGRAFVHAAVHERSVPWLATAGAGDVLAGLITGLLARGADPLDAACAAVWLHVEAARTVGPGLIAEDLSDALPQVLSQLALANHP